MDTEQALPNIFIVEDQLEVLESLCGLLRMSGRFAEVSGCVSAKQFFADRAFERADLVILDIRLPGMNGIDCLVHLKARRPEVKVLMFTVMEHDDEVFAALKAGADGYLLKRENPERMLDAITDALQGGAPMSSDIARRVLLSFRETPHPQGSQSLISDRESAVLDLLAKGHLYKEIANYLGISINTVKQHIHHIYTKLQVQNRTEAVLLHLKKQT
ncbi:MAG: response regulator transcription factor [Thermoanaerobaculia bacterium]|nr:response regulator transcription factor [Thermoanaerobaculia bacterium]